MNIIIIGCGKVGATLAEQLCSERHNIVMVDISAKRLQSTANALDIMGVVGNGASYTVLQDAGVAQANLLIAVTGSDELNLLCCLIAKKAGSCHTIARVRNPIYSKELHFIRQQMGISMIINPELTAASEIARILRFPSAIKIDAFAKGRVELHKVKLLPSFSLDGLSVASAIRKLKCNILICGVERGKHVYIPNGTFTLQNNDMLSVMGAPKDISAFFRKIGMETHQVKNAMIIGGGGIGFYLARLLRESNIEVRIVELDDSRCQQLAELLPDVTVLNGDGIDQQFLLSEGLPNAEAFVTLTNLDEENLLLALFAQKHSSAKVVAKVNRLTFHDVIDSLDIDSIIYPKYLTADYILRYVRAMQNTIGSNVETLYHILDDRAEALEFSVRTPSEITDIPLADLKLKDNLLICYINRGGRIFLPGGTDQIQVGDTVIVVTTVPGLQDIRDILA